MNSFGIRSMDELRTYINVSDMSGWNTLGHKLWEFDMFQC